MKFMSDFGRCVLFFTLLMPCALANCFSVGAQDGAEQLEEQAVRAVAEFVAPRIVQIETLGGIAEQGESLSSGPVTGTVVDASGLIVTATYNLRHKPASIFVNFPTGADGEESVRLIAEEVSRDENLNLTFLKVNPLLVEGSEFKPPKFVERSKVRVGATAIALGKVYSVTNANVSVGIVSAKNRIWNTAVQCDAKISRSNYGGPLVNLQGEVIGILVPRSPDSNDVAAGADWYDSGIGFAVMMDLESEAFEKFRSGQTMRRGLLGISFESSDMFGDLPVVAFSPPTSPAAKAGVVTDDLIISVDGRPVVNQAQLKHAIGPRYEGDVVSVVVERGGDGDENTEHQFDIELAGEIDPFVEPAIGVLFARGGSKAPLEVQVVIDESPAESAGLKPGDRIVSLNDQAVESIGELRVALNRSEIGVEIALTVSSDSVEREVLITPVAENAAMDDEFVPRSPESEDSSVVELRVAEADNLCFAIVPEAKAESAKELRSVLVWVPPPGIVNRNDIEKKWTPLARKWNTIIVVPQSANVQSWNPSEAEFIGKALARLEKQNPFDRQRVAVAGKGAGGVMATFTAFQNRETFRGMVAVDTAIPGRLPGLQSTPTQRLHLLVLTSNGFALLDDVETAVEAFGKLGFPVLHQEDFSDVESHVLRWVHMLDRQ